MTEEPCTYIEEILSFGAANEGANVFLKCRMASGEVEVFILTLGDTEKLIPAFQKTLGEVALLKAGNDPETAASGAAQFIVPNKIQTIASGTDPKFEKVIVSLVGADDHDFSFEMTPTVAQKMVVGVNASIQVIEDHKKRQ